MFPLELQVQESSGKSFVRPVTGGVPMPQGVVRDARRLALKDPSGATVPLQTQVLAHWPDGSAKWVLLDFQANPAPMSTDSFSLDLQEEAAPTEGGFRKGDRSLHSSETSAKAADDDADALLWLNEAVGLTLELTDEHGGRCAPRVSEIVHEVDGPLRGTMQVRGDFHRPDGSRWFQFRVRLSLYAGLSLVRVEPMIYINADSDIFQLIRSLRLVVRTREENPTVVIGGEPSWEGEAGSGVRLFQVDDEQARLEGAPGELRRAPGWAKVVCEGEAAGFALRDFWQQWPKSVETTPGGAALGLLPAFEAGAFKHMTPHYKYQYAFDGPCYRMRTGQARQWDVWLDLNGDGEGCAAAANHALFPFPKAEQALSTDAWGAIEPEGSEATRDYDQWAENLFSQYLESIARQRDYGHLNWGDWFGERFVNWGNHEYDTPYQLLINFARTGDLRYLHMADAAARHMSEIDVVHHMNDDLVDLLSKYGKPEHYPARAGVVHQHTVGHVSGFYSAEEVKDFVREADERFRDKDTFYVCLDPFNLGHVWTQGMAHAYYLTGNPFLKETVELVGDNLARLIEDGEFNFVDHSHNGRIVGWPLIALQGAYETTRDKRFLEAMRDLAYRALDAQDPNCGGWLYHPMARGHCYCDVPHTGMATFITGVMINGISAYYWTSADERIPEAMERAAEFMNRDTWVEQDSSWRYTSCPATRVTKQMGTIMMALVNAVRMRGNEEHERILRKAWADKFATYQEVEVDEVSQGQGKMYSTVIMGCAETVSLLHQLDKAKAEGR